MFGNGKPTQEQVERAEAELSEALRDTNIASGVLVRDDNGDYEVVVTSTHPVPPSVPAPIINLNRGS